MDCTVGDEALARIGALYAIEDEIRGKPADLRLSICQSRAKPLLAELRRWMEKAQRSLSSKSETAGAIRYALSRWRALTRYTEEGLLEIETAPQNGLCVLWHSDAKTFCSPVLTAEANVPPPCIASSARPSSTGSIRNSICALCSHASPIIPSPRSTNSCHGTWRRRSKATLPKLPKTHSSRVRLKTSGHLTTHSTPRQEGLGVSRRTLTLQNRALYEEGHLPVGADKCPIVLPCCSCRDKGSAGRKYEAGLEQGSQVEPKIAKYKSGSTSSRSYP